MSVLKAHPPLSHDNVFPIYTFTCMQVTSPCLLGPSLEIRKMCPLTDLEYGKMQAAFFLPIFHAFLSAASFQN